MKFWQVLTLAAVALTAVNCEFPTEDGVLVLGDDNLADALAQYDKILVEFYAPWCGHCKKLAPEYVKAAEALKDSGIPLAKVDATENSAVAGKYDVKGYPTLKWFVNGTPVEYTGGRTSPEIVNWVNKKSGPPTKALADDAAVADFKENNEVVVIFFGETTSDEFKVFEKVALNIDDVPFGTFATAPEGVTAPGVVLYKKFDEGSNTFTAAFEYATLKSFVDKKSVPAIMLFNDKAAQKIFSEQNPGLFLFRDANTETGKTTDAVFVEVSEQLKDDIFMSKSGVKDGLEARLAEYVGVKDSDLPSVRIIDTSADGLKKYVMTEEISVQNIVNFYNDWKAGKLTPTLKSEDIPATNDEPVKVVVGKSFNDIVLDETKNVLVEFYAPWCGHCKALAPKYDELAKKVAHVDDLVIAKMDSTANEVEGVNIRGFPTLKFWPKGSKTPIDFNGDREVDGFIDFFKQQGIEIPDAPAAEKTDDKEDL